MPASAAVSATLRSSAPAPALDLVVAGGDLGKAAAEPDHDAGDAAVAHQQVRADADHRDRHIGRQRGEKLGQVLGVGRAKQHLGRAADAEPGHRADRRIRR